MMPPRTDWKRPVRYLLGAILFSDLVLLGVVWDAAEHPATATKRLLQLKEENRRLAADVQRATAIRADLPEVRKQCDTFIKESLRPASGGYSAIVAELEKIAADAGLPQGSISFRQKQADKQGIIEVQINAGVAGSYKALVKYVNGLERSKSLYLLDNISLSTGQERLIQMHLLLRTYFRG